MPTQMFAISLVRITLGLFVFILAAWGIFLLERQGRQRTHQNRILIHLSIVLIALLACSIMYWMLTLLGEKSNSRCLEILLLLLTALRWPGYFFLITISMDQLIGVKFPLQYNIVLTERRVLYLMMSCWSSLVFFFILRIFLETNVIVDLHMRFCYPAADVIYLFLIVLTYSYILRALYRRKKSFGKLFVNTKNKLHTERKFLLVSVTVVSLFVFLVVLPDIVTAALLMTGSNATEAAGEVAYVMLNLYGLSIPLVNIFMQPQIRKKLGEKWWKVSCATKVTNKVQKLETESSL